MTRAQSQTEAPDKGEDCGDSTATPMDRFKSLARRLIGVPRTELDEQQRRYAAERRRREKPD